MHKIKHCHLHIKSVYSYIMSKNEIGKSKIFIKSTNCSLQYFQFDISHENFAVLTVCLHRDTKAACMSQT